MIPRYVITITDNKTNKFIKVGADEFSDWKKKTISGKSAIYELLDRAEGELGKASSNSTK